VTVPTCQDCGNTESFVHRIRGTGRRLYVENGELDNLQVEEVIEHSIWRTNKQ
jgi:hypothetical protein